MMTELRVGGRTELLSAEHQGERGSGQDNLLLTPNLFSSFKNKKTLGCFWNLNFKKQLVELTCDADAEHSDLETQVVGHVDLVQPRVFRCYIDQ